MSNIKDGLIYERVKEEILLMIERGSYQAGDRIPSERELASQLKVHRVTLRRAINELISSGVLERRGTRGSYLTMPLIIKPISVNMLSPSISDVVKASGGAPGNKLLYFAQESANAVAAEKLDIKKGDPVLLIKRLRSIDHLPFCIEITTLPMNRVTNLAAEDLLGESSLYDLLRKNYQIEVSTSKAAVSVGTIPLADAKMLGLKRDETALIIHSVVDDTNGKPIEFVASLNHPRLVNLAIE